MSNAGAPFLPGQVPMNTNVDYSKGFALGYTAVLSRSVVNNFRWGFTRQSTGNVGNSDKTWLYFRILDQGITRSHDFQMPIHNFVDDFSWTKGTHSLQFGANIATLRNPRRSYLGSFSSGTTNASWLDTAGFAGTGSPFDPPSGGYPAIDPAFSNSYDFPLIALLGMVTEVDTSYNYDKQGNLLPQGAPVERHFGFSSYEFYAQDAWRIRPNLTVTYGLRYSLYSPPWETTGCAMSSRRGDSHLCPQRPVFRIAGEAALAFHKAHSLLLSHSSKTETIKLELVSVERLNCLTRRKSIVAARREPLRRTEIRTFERAPTEPATLNCAPASGHRVSPRRSGRAAEESLATVSGLCDS